MKKLIDRVIALMALASKDVTRYYLCGVNVTPMSEGKVMLEVGDGHKAVREIVDDVNLNFDAPFFISRDSLTLLKEVKKVYKFGMVGVLSNTHLVINNTHFIPIERDVNYPNMAQIIPSKEGYTHAIALNAEYLESITEALRDSKSPVATILIKFNEDKKTVNPLFVKVGEREAVLMPCRC